MTDGKSLFSFGILRHVTGQSIADVLKESSAFLYLWTIQDEGECLELIIGEVLFLFFFSKTHQTPAFDVCICPSYSRGDDAATNILP